MRTSRGGLRRGEPGLFDQCGARFAGAQEKSGAEQDCTECPNNQSVALLDMDFMHQRRSAPSVDSAFATVARAAQARAVNEMVPFAAVGMRSRIRSRSRALVVSSSDMA